MTRIELIRVAVFVALVATVFALAARTLVRLVLERLGRAERPTKRLVILFRGAILGLAALGLLCVAYGYFVEPNWLDVTHARIATPKLAPGTRPLRIVHISDLHCEAKPRLEEKLPELIARERPDIIVFTGDSLNTREGLPVFRACLTKLATIAPTFVVRGNWDAWYWSDLDLFGGTGARELNGEAVRVTVGGTPLWVAGVAVESEDRIPKVLAAMPPEELQVFLFHYPDEIMQVAEHPVDLYCAGHIHGGQVALPFYGALLTLSKYGKRFEAGLYRVRSTWLYVNRGLGMEGGPRAPRVRFCARPEVTVIDVFPAALTRAASASP
ncbi:MAG TPA: metallophosphoesterase [Isosphaeraceae bacterium]|nr:metallophosphoesterase [Isosphaeraceae bacterium]